MLTHSDHGGLLLIIDDSADNIKLLSTILHEDADLILATNGNKSLSLAKERSHNPADAIDLAESSCQDLQSGS